MLKKKHISLIFLTITIFLSISFSAVSEVFYPKPTNKSVLDVSGKYQPQYISSLESDIVNSQKNMKLVFIDTKNEINVSIYAGKLFKKWEMPEESLLVVIDPYLNKIGYGIGKKFIEELKKEKKRKQNNPKNNNQDFSEEKSNTIDYTNLIEAIVDRFSSDEEDSNSEPKKSKNGVSDLSGGSIISGNSNSEDGFGRTSSESVETLKKFLFGIGLFLIIALIIGLAIRFIFRKKKLEQQKDSSTLEAEVYIQELDSLIETLSNDYEKYNSYKGETKKANSPEFKKLRKTTKDATEFLDKFEQALEEINLEDLDYINDLIEESKDLIEELTEFHDDSVKTLNEYENIIKEGDLSISDIRINIESCKINLESTKKLYKLNLDNFYDRIDNISKNTLKMQKLLDLNDPVAFDSEVKQNFQYFRDIRNEFGIIPHLHSQLTTEIPEKIDYRISNSSLVEIEKVKLKKQINTLVDKALNLLDKGDLEQSKINIEKVFKRVNEIAINEQNS